MNIEKLAIEHGSTCYTGQEYHFDKWQLEAFAKALHHENEKYITSNHNHLVKQVDMVIKKLGLTQEQAWTEGGSLHAPRICNHIQETLDALSEASNKLAFLLGTKALQQSSEPVAEVCYMTIDGDSRLGGIKWLQNKYISPIGTNLYTHPPASVPLEKYNKLLDALKRIGKYPTSREDEKDHRACRQIAAKAIAEAEGEEG